MSVWRYTIVKYSTSAWQIHFIEKSIVANEKPLYRLNIFYDMLFSSTIQLYEMYISLKWDRSRRTIFVRFSLKSTVFWVKSKLITKVLCINCISLYYTSYITLLNKLLTFNFHRDFTNLFQSMHFKILLRAWTVFFFFRIWHNCVGSYFMWISFSNFHVWV